MMRQLPSQDERVTVLSFMGYEGAARKQQEKFGELCLRAEISFKQISYDNPGADDAVKEVKRNVF